MAVLIVYDDGSIAIRQERFLQRSKWGDDSDQMWVGGTYDPDEATMLALIAEAARSATQEPTRQIAAEDAHTRAVELGREGGLKGGPARARALTPARRSEIARNAARARWEASHAASLPFPGDARA